MSVLEDPYRVLGVTRVASGDDIKRAYRRLARRYHPDVNPGDARAETHFKRISEAYDVLSDPAKRELFDRFGGMPAGSGFGRRASDRAAAAAAAGAGFRDIFADIFGGARREASQARGLDIHTTIEIDFEEALRGLVAKIPVRREAPCPTCAGAGAGSAGEGSLQRCTACGGSGYAKSGRLFRSQARACARCQGKGSTGVKPCVVCSGRGAVHQEETISVKVPAGVDNGSKVRVPGRGNAGARGAQAGDLFVVTRVRSHPRWVREGDNLYLKVPISVPEAALGTKIVVPTVDGPATIKIPQGTQGGQRFRLRGRGAPSLRTGGRGDQFVEVYVVVPRLRDERSREIMRELQHLNADDPRKGLFE